MSEHGWTAPGQLPPSPSQPTGPSQEAAPQPTQPSYPQPGHPPQSPYAQPPYAQPGHPSQPPYAQPPYAQPPYAQPPYAQTTNPAYRYPPQPPMGGWRPRMDFRPGIIPLRPLTLNDLFGAVFRAVRGNVAATVGLAALTSLAFLVPFTALGAWVSSQEASVSLEESMSSETAGLVGTIGSALPSIGTSLSTILLAGFLAYVIGQAVLGRKVSAGETWAGTRRRILPLIGATLLTSAIIIGVAAICIGLPIGILALAQSDSGIAIGVVSLLAGGLVAIVALLFLWTRLAFVTPAIVLEGVGVGRAFARSWRLTGTPLFWRLLGIRLLAAIAIGFIASLITAPLAVAGVGLILTGMPADQVYVWQTVITGISAVISGALTTPITAGLDALLFVDHRMRREGLDVQLIQTTQGTAPPPWPRATA